MKKIHSKLKTMCLSFVLVVIGFQSPAYAQHSLGSLGDPTEAQQECYGDDIVKYRNDIEVEAKDLLEELMVGESIKLKDRNRLVIKGVKSVSFDWGDLGRGCRHLTVIYKVTLERHLRRDASGTAEVFYAFKRGSARPGVTFTFKDPVLADAGFELSHLTETGEDWWENRTPDSFFMPTNENVPGGVALFIIPFKH